MAANKDIAPIEKATNKPAQVQQAQQQQTQQAQQGTQTQQAKKEEGAQQQQQQVQDRVQQDDVKLTPDAAQVQAEEAKKAQQEEEAKKAEQEQQVQELAKKIEDLSKQIQDDLKKGDKNAYQAHLAELQGVQRQFDQLTGKAPAEEAAPLAKPSVAGQGYAPPAVGGYRPPAPSFPGFTGGGGFPGFGAPGGGGFHYPTNIDQIGGRPANPNVQIPSFGANASKAQIGRMLDAASDKYGIPPNILKAVAWKESRWRPGALSFDGQHGKGVMQIDDRFHQFAKTQDVFDPAKNIDYGAKYLADLYEKTGSWSAALKRYNGGSDYPPKVLALAEQRPWKRYT